MAWGASAVFRPFITDVIQQVELFDLGGAGVSTFKAALYDNSITPDKDVTSANSAYSAGVWSATGGQTGTPQVYHSGPWAQGGPAIANPVVANPSTGVIRWLADNTASSSAATMSNIYGTFVYAGSLATPVVDQGVCYNYFGGTAASVSNGTFTIVWDATNGILKVTV